jgi:hypothetical protein
VKLSKETIELVGTIQAPFLLEVPSLTTTEEQCYLYGLVARYYESKGAVVEIGTWFGASAAYLAVGLRDNAHHAALYCFDRFELTSSEIDHLNEQDFIFDLSIGDTILPLVQQHLENIYPNIVLQKTEIEQISWDGTPIELLHLDAPKRWTDIVKILEVFGPSLIPGSTVLCIQDFCVPRAYALPLIFGTLADSFELVTTPSAHSTRPYLIILSLIL